MRGVWKCKKSLHWREVRALFAVKTHIKCAIWNSSGDRPGSPRSGVRSRWAPPSPPQLPSPTPSCLFSDFGKYMLSTYALNCANYKASDGRSEGYPVSAGLSLGFLLSTDNIGRRGPGKCFHRDASECCRMLQNAECECLRMLQNASECFRMFQNASECLRMLQNASECFRILQNASEYFRMPQNA